MKTINVSEATNTQLDWLVAKLEGKRVSYFGAGPSAYLAYIPKRSAYKVWRPSTNPAQMWPIIEREGISTSCYKNCPYPQMRWAARCGTATDPEHMVSGPTSLIAAVRCFVVSKLGETVKVPEELV